MKLLFLSNYYPPEARGGYEQWCQEVADTLSERGHEVCVITSRGSQPANGQPGSNPDIHRILELEVTGGVVSTLGRLLKRKQTEATALARVRSLIEQKQPDAALIWGMWNVSRAVPNLVEQLLPHQTAYYFCDYWPSLPSAFLQQLGAPSRRKALSIPKQLVGRLALRGIARESRPVLSFPYPICVSAAVRRLLVEAGVPVEHAQIIHGGTQLPAAPATFRTRSPNDPLNLVYLGRLTADKGVHTAIQAVITLAAQGVRLRLDVWGKGDAEYVQQLRQYVGRSAHPESVRFCGYVDRSEVPALLGNYHVLIFPSEWEEPFARTVLEAMGAGLAVIGTTTGGTGEILAHGETGLTFAAGHAADLSVCLTKLVEQPDLLGRLGRTGHRVVSQNFTFDRMVSELEAALLTLAHRNPTRLAARTETVRSIAAR